MNSRTTPLNFLCPRISHYAHVISIFSARQSRSLANRNPEMAGGSQLHKHRRTCYTAESGPTVHSLYCGKGVYLYNKTNCSNSWFTINLFINSDAILNRDALWSIQGKKHYLQVATVEGIHHLHMMETNFSHGSKNIIYKTSSWH